MTLLSYYGAPAQRQSPKSSRRSPTFVETFTACPGNFAFKLECEVICAAGEMPAPKISL